MRSFTIRTTSQEEQQNQTTNINYILNFIYLLKRELRNKIKIVSNKTEIKQNIFYFTRMIWDQSIIVVGNNKTKNS